ncbi:MAG TPA: hypothetical protein VI489_05065 [Candidatus Brocadiaceae bacterium]
MEEEKRLSNESRRQIDRIEEKVNTICSVLNGKDGRIGVYGKVDIMWGYRNWFIGLFSINLVTLIGAILIIIRKIGF